MSALSNPRNCLHCKSIFLADRRNLRHQRYCAQPACRKESRRQAQARWLSKGPNREYFQGPTAVARVKAWRMQHPGYSRRRKKKTPPALQDDCVTQEAAVKPLTEDLFGSALQDLSRVQTPLLVGLISQTLGSALQEDIVQHVARLVAKGQDLMDTPSRRSNTKIYHGSQKTSASRTTSESTPTVQLAGSATHPAGASP